MNDAGFAPDRTRTDTAPDVERFQPEVARRLAHQAFTGSTRLASSDDLVDYFARPVPFLADVLRELSAASRAALACVYLSGDELPAPVEFTPPLADAVARLGAAQADVLPAFTVADGTFLQQAEDSRGDPVWRFRHPTIREGFARVVAEDTNTVTVFLDGLDADELVHQVDCGGASARGTLVRVPASLYPRVIPRVPVPRGTGETWTNPTAWFLTYRCSPEFLQAWTAHYADDLPSLLKFDMYVGAFWQPALLGRLHQADALPEHIRHDAVGILGEYALRFDAGWLEHPVCDLFSPAERAALLDQIRAEILPEINLYIDESAEGYEDDVEPRDRYHAAQTAADAYIKAFGDDPGVIASLQQARAYIAECIGSAEIEFTPQPAPRLAGHTTAQPAGHYARDEFDDVEQGR